MWQSSVNALELVCSCNPLEGFSFLESDMNAIAEVPTLAVSEVQASYIRNAIAVICGVGVLVFVCMATDGLDMSAGFF